MKIKLIAIKLL